MNAKAAKTQPSSPLDKAEFKAAIVKHLHCSLGTDENKANNHAWWKATCAAIQAQVLEGLRKTQKKATTSMILAQYIIFLLNS